MGSKFLGTDSNNLLALQDGTFNLNVATADIQSLVPSMPVRSSATHQLVSGLIGIADCSFTPITNPATSNLAMATYNISNVGSISGATNSRTADNIISCTTNGVSGNLSTFTGTAKVIQDSGTALSSLATTSSLSNYLLLTGGTMSGNINLGGQEIQNCGAYRIATSGGKTIVGNTSTATGSNNTTALGASCIIDASSASAVVVGYNSSIGTSIGAVSVGNVANIGGSPGAVLVGQSLGATGATDSILIGGSSTSGATRAHTFGKSLTNSTANSILVDASANIRSSSTTCDLGTTALPFRNLQLNGFALSSAVANRIPSIRCTLSDTTAGFGSTTTETNIIQGTQSGSLVIPAGTTPGLSIKLTSVWLYSSGAATTFTIRLKVNGTTVASTVIPAGVTVNDTINCEHIIALRSPASNTRLIIPVRIIRNNVATNQLGTYLADSIWSAAGTNTISMTGQFSDTNGTWRGDYFDMWTSYAS